MPANLMHRPECGAGGQHVVRPDQAFPPFEISARFVVAAIGGLVERFEGQGREYGDEIDGKPAQFPLCYVLGKGHGNVRVQISASVLCSSATGRPHRAAPTGSRAACRRPRAGRAQPAPTLVQGRARG